MAYSEEARHPAQFPGSGPLPHTPATSETILVVDDEDAFRALVVRQLRGAGFGTIEARDGSEAIRIFSERYQQISAVLLDLVMPNTCGSEVLAMLRAYAPAVPVVITSGYSRDAVQSLAGVERGVGFLGKPFTGVELAAELRRALGAPLRPARHTPAPRPSGPSAVRVVRILLVEDNADDQELVRVMLRRATDVVFEIEAVTRLDDAILQLAARRFDALLVDLSLPDSRNIDTIRDLVTQSPDLPLIALTGREDMQTELAALAIGAQDYLIKGRDDARTLMRAIRHAIERKRLENEQVLLTTQLKKALAEIRTLSGLPPG
ncbi:MAG TPA: response regulator [Gemmatimonadaceae bacterium]|nr:response regulator [Gemmatimonadaceae bacterium]